MTKAVLTKRGRFYVITIPGDPTTPFELHDKGRALAWAEGRGLTLHDWTGETGPEEQADDWFPFSEAPQDGRWILVWLDKPELGSHVHSYRTAPPGRSAICCGIFAWDLAGKPTHYRPMPGPPAGVILEKES